MEENVLYKNPCFKKIFSETEFLFNEPVTISQISFDKKTQTENHVLMLGDAAGMITPLCGNGMSMAMHSASLGLSTNKFIFSAKNFKSKYGKKLCYKLETEFFIKISNRQVYTAVYGQ